MVVLLVLTCLVMIFVCVVFSVRRWIFTSSATRHFCVRRRRFRNSSTLHFLRSQSRRRFRNSHGLQFSIARCCTYRARQSQSLLARRLAQNLGLSPRVSAHLIRLIAIDNVVPVIDAQRWTFGATKVQPLHTRLRDRLAYSPSQSSLPRDLGLGGELFFGKNQFSGVRLRELSARRRRRHLLA